MGLRIEKWHYEVGLHEAAVGCLKDRVQPVTMSTAYQE